MPTVLITDISSYKAVVIARYLRRTRPDIDLVATDHRTYAQRIHTRFVRTVTIVNCKPSDGEVYAAELAVIIADNNVDILLPVNSEEIRTLVQHRSLLAGTLDYVGTTDLYHQLDDKLAFSKLLLKNELPHPKEHGTLYAPLPLVVKPARGSSAKGVTYVTTEQERKTLIAELGESPENFVIQDYVKGTGVGYSGFFKNGKPLVTHAHRRVGEYPVSGGSSVVRASYDYGDLTELQALTEKLLAVAPWSGFAMFELKRTEAGAFSFIECNPRIWGSIQQGLANGADYFTPLLGEAQSPCKNENVRTALFPLNVLSVIDYQKAGNTAAAKNVLSGIWKQRLDINPITDPLGMIALLLRGK